MVDSFSEVTEVGFFEQLGDSIKGVGCGLVLVAICSCLLFSCEFRYVKRKEALEGGLSKVVEGNKDTVDAGNEGKLVHINGTAETKDVVEDDKFGIKETGIKLVRKVEMYQWIQNEEKKKVGKRKTKTTYTYAKEWKGSPVNSSKFKVPSGHQNPGSFPYDDMTDTATNVMLGKFKLTPGQISGFRTSPYSLGGATTAAKTGASDTGKTAAADPLTCPECGKTLKSEQGVKDHMKAKHKDAAAKTAATAGGDKGGAGLPGAPAGFKLEGDYLYKAANPSQPEVGDLRISWAFAGPSGPVTIVGKQKGNTLGSYEIGGSDVSGIHYSIETAKEYFQKEQEANVMMLWIVRVVGTIAMIVGFGMIFAPLGAMADFIPVVGDIVDMGAGCAGGALGLILSIFMIALGWTFSRPMIGIPLLILAVGGFIGLIVLAKTMFKKAKGGDAGGAAPAAPPAPAPEAPPAPPAE